MNHEELIKSFKAITDNVKKSDTVAQPTVVYHSRSVAATNGVANIIHKTDPVPPSQSSQPTGSKWTLDALSKNIKSALNINPTNTGAIKDILGLPIKHQLTLLSAISERYVGLKAEEEKRGN
jgi:hypothetical protein